MTHICVVDLTIIGSDNGLSPGRRQAIIWTNAGILLIGPLGTNFSEISIKILTFSFTKMRLKVSSAKWRPFCLGLSVLTRLPLKTKSRDLIFFTGTWACSRVSKNDRLLPHGPQFGARSEIPANPRVQTHPWPANRENIMFFHIVDEFRHKFC